MQADEIYADNLSDISSCSDLEFSDNDSDIFIQRRRSSALSLPESSDSELEMSGDNGNVSSTWSEIDNPPILEALSYSPGLTVLPNDPQNIDDIVSLFIGDDLLMMFVEESNRYHTQNASKYKISKNSIKWIDITLTEMKKFLGLIIIMGKIKKDDIYEYWSTDPIIETPIFAKTMSRDRFRQIWRFWHFCNNENVTENSGRLFKIEPVLDYFLHKFRNIYKPEQELSLDQCVVPWRGRFSFRRYNSAKTVKYGILVRMVCESTSGYILHLEIYTADGKSLETTITSVLSPYLDLWHHVYMGNFYNSVYTAEYLLKRKTRICGIIRKNRGIPPCLKDIQLKKGQSTFRRKNDVLIHLSNNKKRDVRMISTIHSANLIQTQKIDRITKTKIMKPHSVIEYNKYMKSVDRTDQFLSYMDLLRKTTKWTKRIVLLLMNCALFNAFRVYNLLNGKKMRYKQFAYQIGRKWITDEISINSETEIEQPGPSGIPTKRSRTCDPPGRLSMNMKMHTLEKIISSGKKKYPQRACRVCAAHKKRSLSSYICSFCCVPLHRGSCFERYHTVQKY